MPRPARLAVGSTVCSAAFISYPLSAIRYPLQLLPVPGIGSFVRCDHGFVALADREQLVFRHDVLAAILHVVLVDARLDDRIDGACLFAEAAENALEQIDVVTRRAARAVGRDV